ncbi:MAG: PAS-domain containing protein [Alphaproteobacteria bacterium]|jgi:PAS domain S-box-containing protein|nr:PAS-domain containing protein [Alphaproteobacteria bacterium]
MLRWLSIRCRLMVLSAMLVSSLIVTNLVLVNQTQTQNDLIRWQAEKIDGIVRAGVAIQTFGDLRYWVTDLAVSRGQLSARRANDAYERLSTQLDAIEQEHPTAVAGVADQLDALLANAMGAVEAYSRDDQLLGNAMMARGRGHILAINSQLSTLVGNLRNDARNAAAETLPSAEKGIQVAIWIAAVVTIVATVLTFLIVHSVASPLRQMVQVIGEMTAGRMEVPIPPARQDEVGEIARVLALFRESVIRREAAEKTEARLREVIQNVSEGFVLCDADDRIVLSNPQFRRHMLYEGMAPGGADLSAPGTPFETVIRTAAETGNVDAAVGRAEAWIAERMTDHREPAGPLLQQRRDGTWIQINEHKTADGGTVGVYTDITELKRREEELAQQTGILEAMLENMGEGIAMFDAGFNLVVHNKKFLDLWDLSPGQFGPGTPLKDFWRHDMERDAQAEAEIEAITSQRLAKDTRLEERLFEEEGPGGTVIEVRRTPLPTGGVVSTYTDITERKRAEQALWESETRLNAIAEHSPAVICLKDVEGCYSFVNREFERLHGVSAEEVLGKTAHQIFPADIADPFVAHDAEVLAGVEAVEREQIVLSPDGHRTFIEVKFPILEASEHPVAVGLIGTDITDRKRIEQALSESEERYAMAMAGADEGLWDWDAESDMIYVSPRLKTILALGTEKDWIMAADWLELLHPEDRPLHYEALRAHFRGETEVLNVEYRVVGDDGVCRWVLNRGLAMRCENGRVYRMAGWIGDISTRKQAERELQEARDQAMEAARAKTRFLANMSHETRTPLNAILGYTELIADDIYGEVPEKIRDVIERVQRNGRHLLGLINDVLDLAKIEAGQLSLSLSDYSMADIVDTVMAVAESLSAGKDLRLEAVVPPGLPVGVGDEQRLTQVLLNLAGNAIKFTDHGEVAIRVAVEDGRFIVSVRDTGPGISEAEQQLIFEEFHQADSSSTREQGGTGLGLAISKHMLEMHGGRLWVDSVLGEGATFCFELPIRVAAEMEAT